MDKIKVDVEYEKISTKGWTDTEKRADHVSDRMELRGVTTDNIKEAVKKGSKKLRQDGSIVSEFRWYKVIYRQFNIKDIKNQRFLSIKNQRFLSIKNQRFLSIQKVYPITVMEL